MNNKIRAIVENSRISVKSYSTEITDYAFETICNKNNVDDAIQLLIGQAGDTLCFDAVDVYEFFGERRKVIHTFSWEAPGVRMLQASNFDYTVTKSFLEIHKEDKIISLLEINNSNHLHRAFLHGYGSNGQEQILISAIWEDGDIKGFVSFSRMDAIKLTAEDKRNINTTVNVLATYLLKLRVVETVRQKLEFIKNYDLLTKLPTVHKFKKDVKTLLCKHPNKKYAIIYLDFKNFKYINESIGEDAADGILVDFGRNLKEHYSMLNCIGRIESDRFVALLPFTKEEELIRQVQKNNEYFRFQMKKKSIVNNVFLCAGICPIQFGEDINVAIDNANLARKRIGEGQQVQCKFFDQEIKNRIHREIEIEDSMEAALLNNEFVVYLQPKIDLRTETISGAEALVRWKKSETEILPPNEFIPLFERNGFIIDLDYFIYEEVCKTFCKWQEEGRRIIPISVNVSRIHLNDDQFITKLLTLVEFYQIPTNWLELELTESIFLDDKEIALTTMRKLREYGFCVSIDDFGAGYSSLNLLKDMNTDVLKLDKEFFRTGTMNKEDKIIVSSIVNMAKQLNMKVLSEGIETRSQSEFLQSISCDMAQGYLFSKPVPINKFESLLEQKDNNK
ncbi:MAG: GGDEF domain-containing phosphodiesterase [bacterium]|nr:GGDEF domain-containing phosphodiesterase [bacterium]